jgi:hypothetical protein
MGRTVWPALALLGVLAAGVRADEAGEEAARRLFFRLEVGFSSLRTVEGCLTAPAPDVAFDAALLDLDGDGTLETRRKLGEREHARTKRRYREFRIGIRHDDAVFTLEVDALRSPVSARDLGAGRTGVHWSVVKDGLFVRFLDVLRMGPPIALEVGAATRGPNPIVILDVKGPNGGSLAGVRRENAEVRPAVKVLSGGESKVSATPGYS